MRSLLTAAIFIGTATFAQAADFRLYPGFNDKDSLVEMTHDKGLVVEIVLRCGIRPNGKVKPGIMTYSKVEKLFCTSLNRCMRDPVRAADETCGH